MIDRVWRGDDLLARIARGVLIPAGGVYRALIGARGWMYDRKLLPVHHSKIAVVSVGNLSVGGTGKTPFTAWLARELVQHGAQPAIVLRGYGGDEPLVHARLNPDIPVVIAKRRAEGIEEAAQLGASVAVLDDGFQHRSAERLADIVLLAAEQWGQPVRLLPAGPWREPLSALRRAALVVITRKTADESTLRALVKEVARVCPLVPRVIARFKLTELRRAHASHKQESLPISAIATRPVAAIAGVAEPILFFQQLTENGAIVTPFAFPDHHRYAEADISRVLETVGANDALVVCTLKDAVKLAPLWPATGPPLWYVLQGLELESGGDAIADLLARLTPHSPTEH